MKNTVKNVAYFTLITIMISAGTSLQAQNRAYHVPDRQVRLLLNRIEGETDSFRDQVTQPSGDDSVNSLIDSMVTATDTLKTNFTARRSTSADVQDVLNRAAAINTFTQNNPVSVAAQTQWTRIRTDLDKLAGYYSVRPTWNNVGRMPPVYPPNPGYPGGNAISNARVQPLLARLRQRSLTFRQSYERWSNQYDRPNNPGASYDISQPLNEFDIALDNLRTNDGRTTANVEDLLRPAASIDRFVASNRPGTAVTSNWNLIKADLDTLASYYHVSSNWNDSGSQGNYNPPVYVGGLDSRLTGTYRLNSGSSDNVSTLVDRAMRNASYSATDADRVRRVLERRLTSPDALVLEMRGQQITMSSRNGQPVNLTADGVTHTETSPSGRTVTTNVTTTDHDLTINYQGDRANDYYVSFMPIGNGQLKVTRRVYLENQNETVTASSIYDKISQVPDWNVAGVPSNTPGGLNVNGFIIPNNTRIVATLDTPLSTKTSNDRDRFTMTVNSPSEYRGAIIEGNVVGQRSGVVQGRANMSLNFNTIRMLDGRTYSFAGIVEQVRNANGEVVNVNNEGTVRDSSQTTKTVERAGIGALLGGIIGAIAGGGGGAAIGATVGAGAGAGSVVLQGRDNLDLGSGAEFVITATAPSNMGAPLIR